MPYDPYTAYRGPNYYASTGDLRNRIEKRLDTGTYNAHDEAMLRSMTNQAELTRFAKNRFNRPGAILGRIINAGGLEAQDRQRLTESANRQLGMEAEAQQHAYERALSAGGGRQVGAGLRPYGNRMLMAQQQVQDNLNRLAMERKQRALEMQLQLKEGRQQRRFQANMQRQAAYGALAKQLFGLGTAAIMPGGILNKAISGGAGTGNLDLGISGPSSPMLTPNQLAFRQISNASTGLPSGPVSYPEERFAQPGQGFPEFLPHIINDSPRYEDDPYFGQDYA